MTGAAAPGSAGAPAEALRLCLVWPGGGAEHEYYAFAESTGKRIEIFLACSRVGVSPDGDHALPALAQTGSVDWILEAARRLAPLRPDVYYWACTSGSFVGGRAHALEQLAALRSLRGKPAGSTSLGFVAALRALGCRRVSVLATYPEPAARAFESFLAEFGVEVAGLESLDVASGWDAALLDPERIVQGGRRALAAGAGALLVPDTALPTLAILERMEADIGCPVLSANAVTLWDAMRLGRRRLPVPGHGSLLAALPPLGEPVPW